MRHARVFLVEDEALIRLMLAEMIEELGFAKLQVEADIEAASLFHRSIEANRNHPLAHFGLAAALGLLDQGQSRCNGRTCAQF
jgi:DNA-binding response OmpR family regulator